MLYLHGNLKDILVVNCEVTCIQTMPQPSKKVSIYVGVVADNGILMLDWKLILLILYLTLLCTFHSSLDTIQILLSYTD